jgi:hypothetical protein
MIFINLQNLLKIIEQVKFLKLVHLIISLTNYYISLKVQLRINNFKLYINRRQQFQPGTGIAKTPARMNITTLNDFTPVAFD